MTHPYQEEVYLTSREVAILFRVHQNTVMRWAEKGRLAYIKTPGGQYRFPVDQPTMNELREGASVVQDSSDPPVAD